MATSTRVTRSKGESDRLSLPMRSRPTRRDATSGRNGGTALSTSGQEHQQQMPIQMPHSTQLPEAAREERTATALMLPPGPHRPIFARRIGESVAFIQQWLKFFVLTNKKNLNL